MILILTFRHTGDLINKFFTILHSKCALIIYKVNNRDYRFIEKGFYKLNFNCYYNVQFLFNVQCSYSKSSNNNNKQLFFKMTVVSSFGICVSWRTSRLCSWMKDMRLFLNILFEHFHAHLVVLLQFWKLTLIWFDSTHFQTFL